MPKISNIECHKIVNSRAVWTIETHVELDDGSSGFEAVPSGASKGMKEAVFLQAGEAVAAVNGEIRELLLGKDAFDQGGIDSAMLAADGTGNKSRLGGNSILSVSLAVAKAAANSQKISLYRYLAKLYGNKKLSMPVPVFNIINGGKHARNNLSFQEFMAIPGGDRTFEQNLEVGVNIYNSLKDALENEGYDVDIGDEGGFAPNNFTVRKALGMVRMAASEIYFPGEDVFFGLDVAADSFAVDGLYEIKEEKLLINSSELSDYYISLMAEFELMYLEDPFHEGDYGAWKTFMENSGDKIMVVADDLVVTNPSILKSAIENKLANAVIVKPNQVGTLSETFEFIKMAQNSGLNVVVSHRSGDTAEDTFIADLAVAVGAQFIKSGAPARGERVAKYNRLLEIEDELTAK